jgi:Kef-type K+ transport system membrane component KefB
MPMTPPRSRPSLSNLVPAALLACALFVAGTAPAQAYVGPGLGLGAISTALGVVGAIFFGIIAFIWYPFKRLIRRMRRRPASQVVIDAEADA